MTKHINIPDYDPKLSPERNAEIKEWALKNKQTMERGMLIPDDDDEFTFMGEDDFDEDAVSNEDEREIYE
jgi:hypothetical protein